jgi:uncharacterized protein
MTFAIISDIHDNLANLEKVINYINKNKIGKLIISGDLTNPETLSFLRKKFKGEINYVFGNNEEYNLQGNMYLEEYKAIDKNINIFKETGEAKIDNLKIAFTHYPETAKELAKSGKYNLVFFGHTHKPAIETIDKTILLNPGTTGGIFYQPSFAVFNTKTKKPELILLNELK